MNDRRRDLIMVAVQALDSSSSRLLQRAAALAKTRKCDLELVHVIALPRPAGFSMRASVRQAADAILADSHARLQQLTTRRELRGVRTEAAVVWDYPIADGLIRHVLKRRPVMLIAESHRHARLARPFLSNTDWDLIRKCPCPVWFRKSRHAPNKGPVIAALDPLHAHAKPAALDAVILTHALAVAGQRPQRVIACHAFKLPAPPIVDTPIEAYWIGVPEEELKRYEEDLRAQLDRVAKRFAIPGGNRLVVAGDPVYMLPRIAKKHRASVVVLGAVSRSALASLFIGHTAERVIDALDCDVLIVKPRGFKTSVSRRN